MTVPYLSEAYFDCYRLAVEEAKRLGLHVWLYDEYNWPSGTAAEKESSPIIPNTKWSI